MTSIVCQALTQNAIAAVFKNRSFYRTIHQDVVSGLPSGVIALVDLPAVEIKPIAACQSRMFAR
jgi:hypothetical protein